MYIKELTSIGSINTVGFWMQSHTTGIARLGVLQIRAHSPLKCSQCTSFQKSAYLSIYSALARVKDSANMPISVNRVNIFKDGQRAKDQITGLEFIISIAAWCANGCLRQRISQRWSAS
jgi:hypothetical protein